MFAEQRRYGLDPEVVVRTKTWGQPRKWQRDAEAAGRQDLVFTCSWSDWFHDAADPWRDEAWAVVRDCPNLIFQVLTKRAGRMLDNLPADWGDGYENVWLGVTAENQRCADLRVPMLLSVPARLRFVSAEPLLGDLDIRGFLGGYCSWESSGKGPFLDWLIVGCEQLPGHKPGRFADGYEAAARSLVVQCRTSGVPCFHKQMPIGGRVSGDPEQWPSDLRVQDFPKGAK
jgi:protein gp37